MFVRIACRRSTAAVRTRIDARMPLAYIFDQAARDGDRNDRSIANIRLDQLAVLRVSALAFGAQQVAGAQMHIAKLLQNANVSSAT